MPAFCNAVVTRAPAAFGRERCGYQRRMELLLWILAVVLVVAGILALFRRQILWGIVLIIVGLLVGPGGVSIFT
jgi:hypothetical protein